MQATILLNRLLQYEYDNKQISQQRAKAESQPQANESGLQSSISPTMDVEGVKGQHLNTAVN